MNFENSISLNFPAIMLKSLKRFKSFMKLYNPTNWLSVHAPQRVSLRIT